MSEHEHIIVVDDEQGIRSVLSEYFQDHGYRVSTFEDAAGARGMIEKGEKFDIAIIDIAMPGEDGLSLARFLREHTSAGIIMVTASGETVDRIIGIEMGADDYLPKPVDPRELLARTKSVLRRLKESRVSDAEPEDARRMLPFGRCQLDLDAQTLIDEDGQTVPIFALEFQLLKVFAIDVRIARIRRKVERDPGKPQLIRTVRGSGYKYTPE